MKQSYFTSPGFTFRLLPFSLPTALFLLFFLLNFSFGFGQGVTISSGEPNPTQNNPIGISIEFNERINGFEESDINVDDGSLSNFNVEWPNFENTDEEPIRLKTYEVDIVSPLEDIDFSPSSNSVIAIDIDESGFIYALTLDEGVFKYNPNGNLTSNNPLISADKLTEPRDLAIDNNGNIFIANSGADQVLKFDNNGGNMKIINSNPSLSSPSGLAISSDQRVYVADTENNRVAIFNNDGTEAGKIDNGTGPVGLINPIRLAVDNLFNVYVTDAGNNRIQVYDSNGNHTASINGNTGDLNNPGSLVVDDYGFLYVADFVGVNLNTFLNFENIDESQILELVANLENLRIQVFRVDDLNESPKTIKNAINIPIDLALKPCGYLSVNNGDATIEFELNFPPRTYIEFIFDLKTYEILPTKFTAALEINEECIPAEVGIDGEVGVDADCDLISASDEFSRIWDQTKPEIQTCYQEDQAVAMGDEIPNYVEEGLVIFDDNCEGDLEIEQTPAPGTEISQQTTTVRLTATDEAGNVSEACSFELIVEDNTPDTPPVFTNCPQNTIEIANDPGECGAILNFETPEATDDNGSPTITQISGPKNGEFVSVEDGIVNLVFQADDGVNAPVTCTVQIHVVDDEKPVITCPQNITRVIPEGDTSITINYNLPEVSDNCSENLVPELIVEPAPGSEFEEGVYTIEFEVTDDANNTEICDFTITVIQAEAQPEVTCPSNSELDPLSLDQNCDYQLPEFEAIIETKNFDDLNFQKTENRVDNILNVEVKVLEGSQLIETCDLEFDLVDEIVPVIACPQNITREIPEGDTSITINYDLPEVSDNCSENLIPELIVGPASGSEFEEGVYTIEFEVTDDANNMETCDFTITVKRENDPNAPKIECVPHELFLDENGQAILNPEELFVGEPGNLTITADIENFDCSNLGSNNVILTATDPETGLSSTCNTTVEILDDIAPTANCVSGYVVYLDSNGNGTLAPEDLNNNSTDNCGIDSMALSQINFTRADLGDVSITLTVRDEAGKMDSCETTIEVVDEASGDFECRENIVLNLDENGEAGLSLEELYTGNASGINLTASRLNFNCSDLGVVPIQLDYSGSESGSCTINIEVRDENPPMIITDIVELTLDTEGFAYLRESDVLVQDNCSQILIYRFGKSVFSCEDVGSNSINVEVEDANGNITEKNIEVRINGEACEIPDDLKFLFIYPNPNNGIFTIATPKGMLIEQVRVFDSRGRYILQQDYNTSARFYRMTIEGVAASVYTLQIFTNEGVVVKRVIISR
ncbi:Por secretion system C-terminal sorting domain-containing protein [Salegentibacter holothuriorum]|uniref:Por secretion system C-terminal sorting domain-containing protein n=1 Tax=Salegentibacter holothuriorum TaxID=241145 RepID=A0A1T5B004_9FLAO|nr:HYR domain-containing protein [Salegentibacter holothuriorum]SKB40578.1 Por secretion system C-terminal sorting domain-containing protein [Salegentibacter holothuriorum]